MAKRPLAQSLLSLEKEELEISVGKKYDSKILQILGELFGNIHLNTL